MKDYEVRIQAISKHLQKYFEELPTVPGMTLTWDTLIKKNDERVLVVMENIRYVPKKNKK